MQLTLQKDFTFGMNGCYSYGDYSLIPTFGGFFIHYKDKQVVDYPVVGNKALNMISDHIKGSEILTEDDMRFDYETDRDYQLNQEE